MKRIIFCIVVILINFLLLNNLYNNTLINKRFIQVASDNNYVLNSLGSIDNSYNTNSIDALEYNYHKGFKLYEVNLSLTSDDMLVLASGWDLTDYKTSIGLNYYDHEKINSKDTYTPTYDTFMKYKIQNKYTATDYKMFTDFMSKNKDTYFIIDIGFINDINLKKALDYIKSNTNSSLYKRMIFKIYNEEMLNIIKDYKKIKLYSMLYIKNNYKDISEFISYCNKNKISSFITTLSNINSSDFDIINNSNIVSIIDGIDTVDQYNYLNNNGIDLVITNKLAK